MNEQNKHCYWCRLHKILTSGFTYCKNYDCEVTQRIANKCKREKAFDGEVITVKEVSDVN